MRNPSPFDMIRKANGNGNNADRWAALINNSQDRIPVTNEKPIVKDHTVPSAVEQSPTPYVVDSGVRSQLMQPPFPPPQPRHPYLDEIAQRHTQALKSARKSQEWVLHKAEERPKEEMKGDKPTE